MGHVIELKVHQGFNTELQGKVRRDRAADEGYQSFGRSTQRNVLPGPDTEHFV